jgi:hypothetical protein
MSRTVIGVYSPKEQQSETLLLNQLKAHVPLLRELGLATERPALILQTDYEQAILEIFEWKSPQAIEEAHEHTQVLAMWDEFSQISDYRTLASLQECHDLFAEFETLFTT